MREYYLNITDLIMRITAEQELFLGERLEPFRCQEDCRMPDWELMISSSDELPKMEEGGYRSAIACYQYNDDIYRVFHYMKQGLPPFAMVSMDTNGKIQLLYNIEYASFFTGGSGIFNRIGLETIMFMKKRILLHASFIKVRGTGILFSAPSRTGKSTQADLWKKYRQADIINGDRAALAKTDQGVIAWGIPYAGTSEIYRNEKAAVSAIVVLKKAKRNTIRRMQGIEAFCSLYPEVTVHHWEPPFVEYASDILREIICEVPVFLLECLPEESAVELLYETLERGGYFYGTENERIDVDRISVSESLDERDSF